MQQHYCGLAVGRSERHGERARAQLQVVRPALRRRGVHHSRYSRYDEKWSGLLIREKSKQRSKQSRDSGTALPPLLRRCSAPVPGKVPPSWVPVR